MLGAGGTMPGRAHYAATTDEEEERALALAIAASMGHQTPVYPQPAGPVHGQQPQHAPHQRHPQPAPYVAAPARPQAAQPSPQHPRAYPAPTAPPVPAPSSHRAPAPTVSRPGPPASAASPMQPPVARRMHPDPHKCAGCGKDVWMSRLNALNRIWHPGCFVCGFCSGPVNEGGNARFAIGQQDGWPYHMDCYKMRFHPTCTVCQTFVPAHPDGRVEYKEQSFWKEHYCTRHASDGTPSCCSCARYQSKGTEFAQLSDGRHLCLICVGTIVTDTRDAQPLYEEVLGFFRNMGMPHPVKAPFMLVDAFTLNEFSDKEGKDRTGGPVFHVRGLTLATVYRTIPTIMRAAGGGVSSIATSLPQGSVTCSVSAVLVLYGLPRLLTGCIMAHELMHAWLRMKNVAGLDSKVEEGLCQLMAYVWLDNQANSLTDHNEQRLASYFAYTIREDTSVIYGDGFREAYDAFTQRGLTALVNDCLRRGRFT